MSQFCLLTSYQSLPNPTTELSVLNSVSRCRNGGPKGDIHYVQVLQPLLSRRCKFSGWLPRDPQNPSCDFVHPRSIVVGTPNLNPISGVPSLGWVVRRTAEQLVENDIVVWRRYAVKVIEELSSLRQIPAGETDEGKSFLRLYWYLRHRSMVSRIG